AAGGPAALIGPHLLLPDGGGLASLEPGREASPASQKRLVQRLGSFDRVPRGAKRRRETRTGKPAPGGGPTRRRARAASEGRREGLRDGACGLRVVRLPGRPGGRPEHVDPPAASAVLRGAHGNDGIRGGARFQEARRDSAA